jgi:hypothetical protein
MEDATLSSTAAMTMARRDLLKWSSLGALASLVDVEQRVAAQAPAATYPDEIYHLDNVASSQAAKRIYTPDLQASAPAPRQQMLFFYDTAQKRLVNPINVKADDAVKAGQKYKLDATLRSFHASSSGDRDIWRSLNNDLQLQLGVTTPHQDDELTWVILSGVRVFLGGKREGADERLQSFQTELKPTAELQRSAQIEIESARARIQLQLFGQKKASIWSSLLKISGAAVNSFAFGTLAIPKLVSQGVRFTTTVLDHLHSQSRLVPVLSSAQIDFKLASSSPGTDFTLRAGHWVAIDRVYAMSQLDKNFDLSSHRIALEGQFFEVVDKAGKGVDADYAVVRFDLSPVTSTGK